MDFYLGTHELSWMARTAVPLFVSVVRFRRRKTKPVRAIGRFGFDSGGFSELQKHSRWTVDDGEYAKEVEEVIAHAGTPDFAAVRDWMCEPFMLQRTGLTIAEHQKRTIASFVELKHRAPSVPWLPVLQGWRVDDYVAHVEQYRAAGINLRELARVGVGSVCRRQATKEGAVIMRTVAGMGIKVHAFGVKVDGLALFGDCIASADSMAWSFVARRRDIRMPGCSHPRCNNCMRWALEWYRTRIGGPTDIERQLSLFEGKSSAI